ncbi:hypothetical protein D8Y20_07885, partial [Mariprofundus sp. EBB-1]
MGGYMSGRSGWRRKAESQHAVDIQWMKRKGWLYDGCAGSLRWSCRGEETGSIRYRVTDEALTLIYRHRDNGGEWEPVEAKIILTHTPCNYGGKRVWMLCPHCHRRCSKVYIAGKYPACRKCYNLAYYSEAETRMDRAMRQARKAQAKLGYDGGDMSEWLPKPKGMHWKTYYKLKRKVDYGNDMFCSE